MITKNINGNPLSGNYGSTVEVAPRDWQVRLYSDGALLNCGIKSMTITKGSCGTPEAFSVGNVFSSMLSCELLELSDNIKGTDIEVQIGLNTGSYEWITVGCFKAIEVLSTAYSTRVTAYGFSTTKTTSAFEIPSLLSLANIASAIETATGYDIYFDSDIDTTAVLAGAIEPNTSCYGGLQILAHACGGYAVDTNTGDFFIHRFKAEGFVEDHDGNIVFEKIQATDIGDGNIVITADGNTFYSESSGNVVITNDIANEFPVYSDRMVSLPNVEELPFEITGVQVTATGQYDYVLTSDVAIDPNKTYYTRSGSGTPADPYVYTEVEEPDIAYLSTYYERIEVIYTYGSPVVFYDSNPNMSASAFENYKKLVGYTYRTGDIDISLGDPRIEGDDVLAVYDVDGSKYVVPCHIVEHHYDGGLFTIVRSVKATSEGDGIATGVPLTQRLDDIGLSTAMAKASADAAMQYAEIAKETTDEIVAYAEVAGKTVTQILEDAEEAKESAEQAGISASQANVYANSALDQLGVVEDVVGVLDLLRNHGDYQETQDSEVLGGKWYFTRSGTSPDYIYSVVTNPSGDPHAQGWYELIGIDEAIQNYVSNQLVVDDAGLWLKTPSMQTKVLLSATAGVVLYGTRGTVVGKYGEVAQIGDSAGFHIEIGTWYKLTEDTTIVSGKTYYTRSGTISNYVYTEVANPVVADIGTYYEQMPPQIGFYQVDNKVAYMDGSELYVENSLSFGNFVFTQRQNGHFTLKLID